MDKQNSYIVGGHRFYMSMPVESVLWNGVDNYKPFIETEDTIEGDRVDTLDSCVFSLYVDTVSAGTELMESSKVLAEFDDDTAFISVMTGGKGERIFQISLNREMRDRGGLLVIGEDYRNCKLYAGACNGGGHGHFVLNNALMLLYALFTATRNTLLIHASVAVADGKGYVFLGKSGTGKSTHTRLWLNNIPGAWLLNDDNPVVKIEDDGNVMVYGSPWSGKTPCYRNEKAPLGAVVRLSQAPHNSIRRLTGIQAYAALAPSASSMKWDRVMADGLHNTLSGIIQSVGIFHLECLPDADAAHLCHDTVK
ncbi:hypothetical protein I6E11_04795 [Bacteroides caecigallinarum]|uniref:hypothetical protein n=1 Tax=Bacteroides caecigallinarum TaxID=1411144 RepID=UPI001F41AE6F|nr:hypothetical protein [Bacteroides caecigallinarum]MCF2593121.1 hypothetical protein [Bacteroides caecigallinarum]